MYSRNQQNAELFRNHFEVELIGAPEDIENQLVILCVTDAAIPELVSRLSSTNRIAYTSGNMELKSLPGYPELGVFYPLQTFSKDRQVNFFEIPFFIEANNSHFAQELFDLAWKLSRKVQFADSSTRKQLHLAAVICNNFSNYLLTLSKEQLENKGIDWKLLHPLIAETVSKATDMGPENAQTGPARRGDRNTIREQLEMLGSPLKEVYLTMSKAILERYHHEKL